MRRIGQMLLVLTLAVLCLAAGSALVVGPAREAQEPVSCAGVEPMTLRAVSVPADEAAPLLRVRQEERADAPHTEWEDSTVTCVVVSDGNGWPVTGRTWTRTVYAVCPPEGMPG